MELKNLFGYNCANTLLALIAQLCEFAVESTHRRVALVELTPNRRHLRASALGFSARCEQTVTKHLPTTFAAPTQSRRAAATRSSQPCCVGKLDQTCIKKKVFFLFKRTECSCRVASFACTIRFRSLVWRGVRQPARDPL